MSEFVSPVTKRNKVNLEQTIDKAKVVEGYKQFEDIDVSRFFKNIDAIKMYQCNETGYRFFYPFTISGDADFYKQLQINPWYYEDWKWEYDVVYKIVPENVAVLEIGCGKGAFLKKLKEKNINATGLELNDDCVEIGKKENINILNQTIEEFSEKNESKFDWVLAFQVLEHINDVHSFISASVKCLKPGGKILFAVPNNKSLFFSYKRPLDIRYFQQQKTLIKNMPPHHMGCWDEFSLQNISGFFGLSAPQFHKEPLPKGKRGIYAEIIVHKFFGKSSGMILSIITKLLSFAVGFLPMKLVQGNTIIAVYSKNY